MIIQHLWNVFQNEGSLVYTDIYSLEFDVNENHIDVLLENYIIECNPSNKSEIRMIDFTDIEVLGTLFDGMTSVCDCDYCFTNERI